jgi:hypothetical protein
LPEILRREIAANGKSKEVDHLIDMRPDEMGPEDAYAPLLDQGFVAVDSLSDPEGRVPVRDLLAIDPESEPGRARAANSLMPTAAIGGNVKATLGTPR